MSGKENLSLDEFATAPRRQRRTADLNPMHDGEDRPSATTTVSGSTAIEDQGKRETTSEARRALREMKRVRMKGASHFVNVNLDRETKRRLKFAAFNSDTSMQVIMEKAIRQFLDANGY